ncbi:MAG: DUF2892 domain-containing protein [Verrucomicrobia bacterium]|nr:DUF2892 domain-containing protein [Verrucomicrobiota bacterium]
MKNFFRRNLDGRGRAVRALAGLALLIGGLFTCPYNLWLATALIISGGFVLFEAARGWCVMRACGIKTKI